MFDEIDRFLRGEEVAPPTAVDSAVSGHPDDDYRSDYLRYDEVMSMSDEGIGVPDISHIASRGGKETVRATFRAFYMISKNAQIAQRNGKISGLEAAQVIKDIEEFDDLARWALTELACDRLNETQANYVYIGINEALKMKLGRS